jgi:hypothetical protein
MSTDPPDQDRGDDVGDQPEPPHEHVARLHHALRDVRSTPTPGFAPSTADQALRLDAIDNIAMSAAVALIPEHAAFARFQHAYRKAVHDGAKPSSGISPQKTAS